MSHSKELFMETRESESGQVPQQKQTPVQVFSGFTPSKSDLGNFQERIRLSVLDGSLSALEVMAKVKTAQKYIEAVIGDGDRNKGIPEVKELARSEAEQYGDKVFHYRGLEVQLRELGSRNDYAGTQDPEWANLQEELVELKARIKTRESYLASLTAPVDYTDQNTGEVVTITPPVKKSTSGLMFSLR